MTKLSALHVVGVVGALALSACDEDQGRRLGPLGLADDDIILGDNDSARRATIEVPDQGDVTILFEDAEGTALYGGDIVLGDADLLGGGFRAAAVTGKLWPAAQVRWLDTGIDPIQREVMLNAMAKWEAVSVIRFVEITEQDAITVAHVKVTNKADGCSSGWGYPGPGASYKLKMGPFCVGESVWMHELGHAIGLLHEHARSDRDQYITIQWDNIRDGMSVAFDRYDQRVPNGVDLGPYDFDSVMHYDSEVFSVAQDRPTMLKKDGSRVGANIEISKGDAAAVNQLYADAPKEELDVFPGSCQNRCEQPDMVDVGDGRQCSCHQTCKVWDDCCEDYAPVCDGDAPDDAPDGNPTEPDEPGDEPAPGDGGSSEPTASCIDRCGNYDINATCQCDDLCESSDDCCSDFEMVCNAPIPGSDVPVPEPKPPTGPSCAGHCNPGGSPDGVCFCDSDCVQYGDCCDDQASVCG